MRIIGQPGLTEEGNDKEMIKKLFLFKKGNFHEDSLSGTVIE